MSRGPSSDTVSLPLEPLDRISPSLYYPMTLCLLRGLWDGTRGIPRLLPLSPNAILGRAIHEFLELSSREQITTKDELEQKWAGTVCRIEARMKKHALEAHLVPLSRTARNYHVKRKQAFNKGWEISKARQDSPGSGHYLVEHWVESKDGKVGGRIDAIRKINGQIKIIDLKTGNPFEEDAKTIRKEYLYQLKLYAALYWEQEEEWPGVVCVRSLASEDYNVDCKREECLSLLAEAKSTLDKLNSMISEGAGLGDLAHPGPDVCRFCNYRPACPAYWAMREDHEHWPLDISGAFLDVVTLGNGLHRLRIAGNDAEYSVRNVQPTRHSKLRTGDTVMICNLVRDIIPNHYVEGLLTTIYIINN